MPCRPAQISEHDAFLSSLVGDLVSEKNDKCQVVRKYGDRVLNAKGEVKGLIHEERKVLSEKQSKEKQKQKRKEEKHKEELCQLRCKSKFSSHYFYTLVYCRSNINIDLPFTQSK